MLFILVCLISATSGAPTSGSNSTRSNKPERANIPPLISQCFYEGRWFPAGSVINAGRSGDWCYGSFCDLDGHVKHWDDYNCPPPDRNNPHPPFPNIFNLQQQQTTTTTTTTTTATPPRYWFPTTTSQPLLFNFDRMGCFYGGQFYWAGQDIETRRRGRRCFGSYCDWNAQVRHWEDDCRYTLPPPTRPPDIRPGGRRAQNPNET